STSTLANVPAFRSRWRCPSLPSPRIGRDRGPCVRPPPAVPAPPPERSACAVLLPLATRAAPLEADRCGGRRARYRSFCSRLRARLVPLLGKSAFIEYAPPVSHHICRRAAVQQPFGMRPGDGAIRMNMIRTAMLLAFMTALFMAVGYFVG